MRPPNETGTPPMNETPSNALRELAPVDPRVRDRRRRAARRLGAAAVLVLAALVAVGVWHHVSRYTEAVAVLQAEHTALPLVRTAIMKPADAPRKLDLAGSIQAFDSATLFARATGYIGKRNVDIGSRVHAGDVLAVISAPDLDQQLAQARAQLAQMEAAVVQAEANTKLAQVTNSRTAHLLKGGWTSAQQGDTDRLKFDSSVAATSVARANLMAQRAQVNRLEQLAGFEKVKAPFDGVITSRQVDVGSLVTADANNGTPLFSIAHTSVLRVQVYVPQNDFFGLKDGQAAEVTVPELPGRVFPGTLARNAGALQPDTRTVLAEVDVDNANGTLAPGLYAIVHLRVPRTYPVFVVPSQAVIFDKNGLSAAVYDNGMIHLRKLDLAADNGASVEVRAGLRPGDRLVLNPPIGVTDGMRATAQ